MGMGTSLSPSSSSSSNLPLPLPTPLDSSPALLLPLLLLSASRRLLRATPCSPCNLRKGSRTLRQAGLHLARPPRVPTAAEMQAHGRRFPPNHLHQSWMDYLYWDAELDA